MVVEKGEMIVMVQDEKEKPEMELLMCMKKI
jgi:hypothetical protein